MHSSDDLDCQLRTEECRRYLAHVYPRTMSEQELALLGKEMGPDIGRSERKKRDTAVRQLLAAAMMLLCRCLPLNGTWACGMVMCQWNRRQSLDALAGCPLLDVDPSILAAGAAQKMMESAQSGTK